MSNVSFYENEIQITLDNGDEIQIMYSNPKFDEFYDSWSFAGVDIDSAILIFEDGGSVYNIPFNDAQSLVHDYSAELRSWLIKKEKENYNYSYDEF